jgi:hypothetical protein
MRSTTHTTDTREKEVLVVVDVDELHTPEYEANLVTVDEEAEPGRRGAEPSQEVGQIEEDTERIESDTSRGPRPRQVEKNTVSAPQSHELEVGQETIHEDVPEVGASPPQSKRKGHAESSVHRGSQPQFKGNLVLSKILSGVRVDDDMVRGVTVIKYSDHDVAYVTKFPDPVSKNYLERRGEGSSGMPLFELTQWILELYKTCIMNLLDVPHFGWGKHINACVKQLLARVHDEILWMDRSVPIIVDLIETTTGLPTDGEKTEQYLEDKTRAKAISYKIKAKYGMERSNRGIRISDINDLATMFSIRFLRCKLMCKCHKEEVSIGVVATVVQCAKGRSMRWGPYLLNSFLEYCKDT